MMVTIDILDKSEWYDGEWKKEADTYIWSQTINEREYYCMVMRFEELGALNGYVGVGKNYFAFQKHYFDKPLSDIDVHGGLTYADFGELKTQLINQYLEHDFEDEDLWWFGFDCSHAFDYRPEMSRKLEEMHIKMGLPRMPILEGEVYRNKDFVIGQVNDLVLQLSNLQVKYDLYTGKTTNGVDENELRAREELFKDI